MPPLKLQLESEEATHQFGVQLGSAIQIAPTEPGLVIALNGTLGAGKTRLTQAIAEGLGIKAQVTSPTYTICIPYSGRVNLLHLDAYRIIEPEEVDELDLDYRVQEGEVLIVEWADRIKQWMPDIDMEISIAAISDTSREFTLTSHTSKGSLLVQSAQNFSA